MKNRKIIIFIIILLLTGCYDRKELNNIAILTATEINKIDNEFMVKAQVVNPQSADKTTTTQAPFIVYVGRGKSIQEAYRNIKLQSSRYLYPDHLQIMIIGEEIAKEDINEIMDFYLRDPSVRTEFKVLIGRNEDILSLVTPIDELSSSSILGTLEVSNKFLGVANMVTFNELASMRLNPNREIIMPSIILENKSGIEDKIENTDKTTIDSMYKIGGLAIFKDNKLVGYLSNKESITYNIVMGAVENTIVPYECAKDKYISLEMIDNKTKINIKNKIIYIDIKQSFTINELNCDIKLNDYKEIAKLENELAYYLERVITDDINKIRNNYNADVFGFLDTIYKHDYNYYIEVKDNWYRREYQKIPIVVKVNTNIISRGNVMEGNNEKN